MTKAKVIRDSTGKVINIGDWDYMEEKIIDIKTNTPASIIHNPLPDGVTFSEEEIEATPDGGLKVVSELTS